MIILHVAPHLGGGVGKAHAALAEARAMGESGEIHRFVLLEAPVDRRFADRIAAAGCEILIRPDREQLARLVDEADIVQVEWWSHPRLYELLAGSGLPPHRLILWTHVSGLAPPVVPARLAETADRTVFTSHCSFDAPNLKPMIAARPEAFAMANSGFGFSITDTISKSSRAQLSFGYLGTLDFAKLHPGLFSALDAARNDVRLNVFGQCDPTGPVARSAAAMRHRDRAVFFGHSDDPAGALSDLDVFVYPLSPGHYGTGENALVEAMSLGLCPLVIANPAESAIVAHGKTGIVADGIEDCTRWLDWMSENPDAVRPLGANAARHVAEHHMPTASLASFAEIYGRASHVPKRVRDYTVALGYGPVDWFLASLGADACLLEGDGPMFGANATKGSLAHFRLAFPGDVGLCAFADALSGQDQDIVVAPAELLRLPGDRTVGHIGADHEAL